METNDINFKKVDRKFYSLCMKHGAKCTHHAGVILDNYLGGKFHAKKMTSKLALLMVLVMMTAVLVPAAMAQHLLLRCSQVGYDSCHESKWQLWTENNPDFLHIQTQEKQKALIDNLLPVYG
jgi:predicted metal-dependent hydrolase